MGVKLEKGYYGSDMPTYGTHSYRGYDVIVDDSNMGMPEEGGTFLVGLYKSGDNSGQAIDMREESNFSLEKAGKVIDLMIDFQTKHNLRIECTCGAKHTSNPNHHLDWCSKK